MENHDDALFKLFSDRTAIPTSNGGASEFGTTGFADDALEAKQNTESSRNLVTTVLGTGIAVIESTDSVHKAKGKKNNGREPKQCINVDGKKRYICPFPGCNKTFSTSGHTSRHSRIHTGEKPYRCTYPNCNAQFSRYDNSVQHYRTHMVTTKGQRKGRKSKDNGAQEGTHSLPMKPEVTKSSTAQEPVRPLKRRAASISSFSDVDQYATQVKLAKVGQLGNSVGFQPISANSLAEEFGDKPSNERPSVQPSLAPGSAHQTWVKPQHSSSLRAHANMQSLSRSPFPEHGNSVPQGNNVLLDEYAPTVTALDNLTTTHLNSKKAPNTTIQQQVSDSPSYTLNSSNNTSSAFFSGIPHGPIISPELLLARERRLSHGPRISFNTNGDSQVTRPANFQLRKSGSMPSLLSLELPRSDSSHSLSKYSLSSGSPTLTPSSSFKGPSSASNGKHF